MFGYDWKIGYAGVLNLLSCQKRNFVASNPDRGKQTATKAYGVGTEITAPLFGRIALRLMPAERMMRGKEKILSVGYGDVDTVSGLDL